MHLRILLASLVLFTLPATASAAPAKISPRAAVVSQAGVATVEAANPNRHTLRGTATVSVGNRTITRRSVRLARQSVTGVMLRFDRKAMATLRAADGRATITLRLRRPGGRPTTVRRRLTLRLAAAMPQVPPSGTPAPVPVEEAPGSSNGPAPTSPASAAWAGRMGAEGPYDDFELTTVDGTLQFTTPPVVPVACFEVGGANRSSLSFELFDALGPWTVGADATVAKQGIAVNQLVTSGARTINYKVTGTTQQQGRLAGTLGMSFFDSRYDFPTNTINYINCAGSQSFEAVPRG